MLFLMSATTSDGCQNVLVERDWQDDLCSFDLANMISMISEAPPIEVAISSADLSARSCQPTAAGSEFTICPTLGSSEALEEPIGLFGFLDPAEQYPITFAEEDLKECMASLYELRGGSDVANYILGHPDIVATMLEIPGVVERFFGHGTSIALETRADPEEHDEALFVLIQVGNMSPEDANSKLDAIYDSWWISTPYFVESLMELDVEYNT